MPTDTPIAELLARRDTQAAAAKKAIAEKAAVNAQLRKRISAGETTGDVCRDAAILVNHMVSEDAFRQLHTDILAGKGKLFLEWEVVRTRHKHTFDGSGDTHIDECVPRIAVIPETTRGLCIEGDRICVDVERSVHFASDETDETARLCDGTLQLEVNRPRVLNYKIGDKDVEDWWNISRIQHVHPNKRTRILITALKLLKARAHAGSILGGYLQARHKELNQEKNVPEADEAT